MSESIIPTVLDDLFASDDGNLPSSVHGLSQNKNGGSYIRGATYDLPTKLRVADAIHLAERNDGRLVVSRIANACGVSDKYVNTVRDEMYEYGRVLSPKEKKALRKENRKRSSEKTGVGTFTISTFDSFVLYALYTDEPSRSLRSYQEWLFYFTGTEVSRSTISRYFKEGFDYSAGFVKPNMVPYDKFKPENIAKAYEYITTIIVLDPERLVFADEKLIKGQELFNRLVRRDPITGEKPAMIPDPDFRNTHSITGFCSFSSSKRPVVFRIHEGNNNAEQFAQDVEEAIACGYIRPGDILVLDNAAYHTGRGNNVIEEWLWDNHGILLIFLPPRSPEWNPIELVWAILVRRLRTCDLRESREQYGVNASANKAADILEGITREEVLKCFRHCYRFIVGL